MPEDKEYWKKAYKDIWPVSTEREKTVRTILESAEFIVTPFGFEAESDNYNAESPDEKGKPDYKVEIDSDAHILLEITGTNIASVTEQSAIWIRPDKFAWADKHSVEECWFAHVLDKKGIIRFGRLTNGKQFPIIHPMIRGKVETYHEIDVTKMELLSLKQFIEYLTKKRSS